MVIKVGLLKSADCDETKTTMKKFKQALVRDEVLREEATTACTCAPAFVAKETRVGQSNKTHKTQECHSVSVHSQGVVHAGLAPALGVAL